MFPVMLIALVTAIDHPKLFSGFQITFVYVDKTQTCTCGQTPKFNNTRYCSCLIYGSKMATLTLQTENMIYTWPCCPWPLPYTQSYYTPDSWNMFDWVPKAIYVKYDPINYCDWWQEKKNLGCFTPYNGSNEYSWPRLFTFNSKMVVPSTMSNSDPGLDCFTYCKSSKNPPPICCSCPGLC
jgi:hypothetical protein